MNHFIKLIVLVGGLFLITNQIIIFCKLIYLFKCHLY